MNQFLHESEIRTLGLNHYSGRQSSISQVSKDGMLLRDFYQIRRLSLISYLIMVCLMMMALIIGAIGPTYNLSPTIDVLKGDTFVVDSNAHGLLTSGSGLWALDPINGIDLTLLNESLVPVGSIKATEVSETVGERSRNDMQELSLTPLTPLRIVGIQSFEFGIGRLFLGNVIIILSLLSVLEFVTTDTAKKKRYKWDNMKYWLGVTLMHSSILRFIKILDSWFLFTFIRMCIYRWGPSAYLCIIGIFATYYLLCPFGPWGHIVSILQLFNLIDPRRTRNSVDDPMSLFFWMTSPLKFPAIHHFKDTLKIDTKDEGEYIALNPTGLKLIFVFYYVNAVRTLNSLWTVFEKHIQGWYSNSTVEPSASKELQLIQVNYEDENTTASIDPNSDTTINTADFVFGDRFLKSLEELQNCRMSFYHEKNALYALSQAGSFVSTSRVLASKFRGMSSMEDWISIDTLSNITRCFLFSYPLLLCKCIVMYWGVREGRFVLPLSIMVISSIQATICFIYVSWDRKIWLQLYVVD